MHTVQSTFKCLDNLISNNTNKCSCQISTTLLAEQNYKSAGRITISALNGTHSNKSRCVCRDKPTTYLFTVNKHKRVNYHLTTESILKNITCSQNSIEISKQPQSYTTAEQA